ncbi:MAG: hypothetical protein WCO28_12255 [Bacteroidota bacterium]
MEKVLVVYHYYRMRRCVSDFLKVFNYDVCVTKNRADIIDEISKIKPNIILIDLRTIEVNAKNFLVRLKQQQQLNNTPIIFIANNITYLNKVETFEKISFVFSEMEIIDAPFKLEYLLESIQTHLKNNKKIIPLFYSVPNKKQQDTKYKTVFKIQ